MSLLDPSSPDATNTSDGEADGTVPPEESGADATYGGPEAAAQGADADAGPEPDAAADALDDAAAIDGPAVDADAAGDPDAAQDAGRGAPEDAALDSAPDAPDAPNAPPDASLSSCAGYDGSGPCAGVCNPGQAQCSFNTPQSCGDGGQWVDGILCSAPSSYCFAGHCEVPPAGWYFATSLQGWGVYPYSVPSNLYTSVTASWDGAVGNPLPGSAHLSIPFSGNGDNVNFAIPLASVPAFSLANKVLRARVYLDSGEDVVAYLYMQTLPGFAYADGGPVTLTAGRWTLLTLDASSPQGYVASGFNPANVDTLGVSLRTATTGATSAAVVHVDSVTYE